MTEASDNPLRSEAAMFRVLVVVAVAALPVIVLGLIVGPLAGAILLVAEVGFGVWWIARRLRAGRDEAAGGS